MGGQQHRAEGQRAGFTSPAHVRPAGADRRARWGASSTAVVISELKEHTYYARLQIKHEGEIVEIDARPSDSIAVAVTCRPHLPIYVAEEVLNDVLGE